MISPRNPAGRNLAREVAVVAAALLLPVPLLAATGVHLPLPAAVERGLASVTPDGSFNVPIREAAPSGPDTTPAEKSAGDGVEAPGRGGEQASSSVVVPPDPDSRSTEGGARAGRPQEGADEQTTPLPPDTGSDDPPGGDSPEPPRPEGPPAEPDTPPAAPAEAPDELAVGLDAGGVSTEVAAGSDGIDVTVSADGLLPPTTLPLPLP